MNPQQFLKGFNGTIITDGYYGYNHTEGITMHTVGHMLEENSMTHCR